jgi:hypothetical protein
MGGNELTNNWQQFVPFWNAKRVFATKLEGQLESSIHPIPCSLAPSSLATQRHRNLPKLVTGASSLKTGRAFPEHRTSFDSLVFFPSGISRLPQNLDTKGAPPRRGNLHKGMSLASTCVTRPPHYSVIGDFPCYPMPYPPLSLPAQSVYTFARYRVHLGV